MFSRASSPKLSFFVSLLLFGLISFALASPSAAQTTPANVVISQVYGGGGNSGATYTHDFVELFNRGATPISLAGWSIQYASSSGTTWSRTDLSGSLQPGQYFLIQQAQGSGGTISLPTPDTTGTIAMGASAGKLVLVNNNTTIGSGISCPSGVNVVDLVGFGGANCFEGSGPTATLNNTTAALRANNGCTDANNNASDFSTASPAPRNTVSPLSPCVASTNPNGSGSADPATVTAGNSTLLTVAITPGANPASTGLAVTGDLSGIGGSAAQSFFDDGSNGDITAGDNVFSYLATVDGGTSAGIKSLPITIGDAQGRSGNTTIAVTVQLSAPAGGDVVISQVYGGGGNSGASYRNDFIELFNRSDSLVNLSGWSVQYASATGTSWQVTSLSGSLAPGKYYLIQQAQGSGGTTDLPTPDAVGTISMGASAGKVALVNNATALSGACPTSGIVDFVGFGATANCFEGSGPTPAPSNTSAALRQGSGNQDTDNNAADFVVGAPAPRNSQLGEDAAPSVTSTTPTNGATDAPVDANIIVNFSEAVAVADNWFDIQCDSSSQPATVSGGPQGFILDPVSDLPAGESCTVTIFAANVIDQDGNDPPAAMAANYQWGFSTAAVNACELSFEPVYAIQGSGAATPLNTVVVTTQAVVVGDFQGSAGHQGFYLQDPTGDGNDMTSDGIFVFIPATNSLSSVDVAVGDIVRVTGRATEFNTLTEIDNVTALRICGTTTPPAPTGVTLPEVTNNDLERYEGMLITVPQTLTVSQNFFQGRYGQVTLSAGSRLFNPTNLFAPGSTETIALADENARRLLVLDDGRSSQNPNPIPYIGQQNTLRVGDTVAGLTGVLDYGLITSDSTTRDYRLQPTITPNFTRVNQRTVVPRAVDGNLKVASFNVLNYFNGNGTGDGFPTPRGANTLIEFNRQRAKIIAAITAMDADIIGLMELENDAPPNSAIEDLVTGVNAATAPDTYRFINTGIIGTDEIRVAILYRPANVTPINDHAILTSAIDSRFLDTKNRPALAQTFAFNSSEERFTVVVNHLKSKSSNCNDVGDPDTGDGQGNCNLTRLNAVLALAEWLTTDPTGSGDPDFLIIGDLNSYALEDPITALRNAGYTDLLKSYLGDEAYSYIFDGQSGYLDHALATSSLTAQVTGVTEWHINTDEPSVIDYNTEFKPQDLYEPTPYRSSDHDPVIVGFCLRGTPPPLSVTVTPDLLWPPNHKYVTVTATASSSDPNVTINLIDVTSNEPDNGLGDGDTPNDIVQLSNYSFNLRAERAGNGSGRIYTLTYEAIDACGYRSEVSATVTVPLSRGRAENSPGDRSDEAIDQNHRLFLPSISQ